MARPRKDSHKPTITAADIKAAARRQMGERGTAGLALRGIARELGITAPAIYNYFPRLEDLITALIIDAFTALADAMGPAGEQAVGVSAKLAASLRAYRAWGVAHPVDFQLIYGNPIPGYHAPGEITGPLAWRPFAGLFTLLEGAWQRGELAIPAAYTPVPPQVAAFLTEFRQTAGLRLPNELVCALASGWARIHGQVMLELFEHSQALIGDPAAFYELELRAFLRQLGLPPPD